MKKQTALEWLLERFGEAGYNFSKYKKEIGEAKEMEREQICQTFSDAWYYGVCDRKDYTAEDYYKNKFVDEKIGVVLYDIEYDTDGETIETTEITTTLEDMGWSENDLSPTAYIDECGADYISDVTGWLVKSFKYKIDV